MVAAFVATGDALAAFHTILVGEACTAAEVVPHCAGEGRRPSTACEGFYPSPHPTRAPTTTPAPMSGSRGARTSSGGDGGGPKGNFKVVFGMIVFFVPLGLALPYCSAGVPRGGRRGAALRPQSGRLRLQTAARRACSPAEFA